MKFYLREKFCFSGIFLCVAISTKSLQCTDFEIMVGLSDWLVICPLGLQVKIKTAAQPQCMKSAYNHQHELLHTSWFTLPVCLAHSCPTPQVLLLVGPKTVYTAKSTQFTSQSGFCSMEYKSVGFIFINSQKPDYPNKKIKLYSSIISLHSHTPHIFWKIRFRMILHWPWHQ